MTTVITGDVEQVLRWTAEQLGMLTAIGLVLRIFFQPFIDTYILKSLQRKHIELKDFLEGGTPEYPMFKEDGVVFQEIVEQVRAHRDAVVALREMIDGQGGALLRLETKVSNLGSMQEALDRIDRAVEKMADSISETRDIVLRMQGEWNGQERRRNSR